MGDKQMSAERNGHALPNQEKWIVMSRAEIKRIFEYYIVLFLISLLAVLLFIRYFELIEKDKIGIFCIVLFSFSCGILGGTFYYIRKLYKSCIQSLVNDIAETSTSIESIGAKVYFYFRPIMGAVLSIFITLGVYAGVFVLLDQPAINSDKFYIFVGILAFISGFSNGKLIVKLDNTTDKFVEKFNFSEE